MLLLEECPPFRERSFPDSVVALRVIGQLSGDAYLQFVQASLVARNQECMLPLVRRLHVEQLGCWRTLQ
jgi:hypothetical protein